MPDAPFAGRATAPGQIADAVLGCGGSCGTGKAHPVPWKISAATLIRVGSSPASRKRI